MGERLKGKVAVVTGGASGVGEATARLFAAEGARVLITDVNEKDGERLAGELRGKAGFYRQDVSDPKQWDELAKLVTARIGKLDILVNNAGILIPGTIEETCLEDWHKLHRVNADSIFLGCKTAIASMKETGGGSIVNMSSIAALGGIPNYLAYSASKGSVAALTRSVAVHCRQKKYRIRCNSVHPDGVLTPMTRAVYPEDIDPESLTIDVDPMNRACRPEDVAEGILYLASDQARAVNGIELRIDSGQFVMSI
ncbi:glucose 1-dehydrogenase [Proteobacteria bacterium 005FR1]|nr:glucose 1-dehydrogenase [Proteobacteria bacterium 005FR1]